MVSSITTLIHLRTAGNQYLRRRCIDRMGLANPPSLLVSISFNLLLWMTRIANYRSRSCKHTRKVKYDLHLTVDTHQLSDMGMDRRLHYGGIVHEYAWYVS